MKLLNYIKQGWEYIQRNFLTPESYCGSGSYVKNTQDTIEYISHFIRSNKIKSVLDLGCGDWNWMRYVYLDGVSYVGYDFDKGFIDTNSIRYPQHTFIYADVTLLDKLPKVDLIICRDLLLHLKEDDILSLLSKITASGSKYFMSSTYHILHNQDFTEQQKNKVYTRKSRPSRAINLHLEPYNLPVEISWVYEGSCADRDLATWRIADINNYGHYSVD